MTDRPVRAPRPEAAPLDSGLIRAPSLVHAALAAVVVWAACADPAAGQAGGGGPGTPAGRPLVGLALSGGSAKGFAHIGVIRVLEEMGIPVDVVAGTSMGSLVGALYAIGFDPEEVADAARGQDWDALFTDRMERDLLPLDRRPLAAPVLSFPIREGRVGLPTGVVRGDRIVRTLERLTWRAQAVRDFDRLPRPFAAVATDLGSGEAVVLRSGVLAEAIRASLAIPGAIRPERVEGRLLVDGGIARNLPAEDVRALGADVVICSDVSDPPEAVENLRSLFDVVLQTVTFQMRASSERQRGLCDVLVQPEIGGLSELAFGSVDEWVARGVDAARESAEALRAAVRAPEGPLRDTLPPATVLADTLPGARPATPVPPEPLLPERVWVRRVEFRGVEGDARRTALRTVALEAPLLAGADTLDRALARLHATNLFSEAMYHVEAGPADTAVVFTLTEGARDEAGFGFRYDDHRKASLLFSATLYNLLDYGSSTRVDLRLGEESHLGAQTVRGLGDASRFSLAVDVRYTRALFDEYEGTDQVAQIRSKVLSASALLGIALGRTTMAAFELQAERAESFTAIAPTDTSVTETFWSLSAQVWRDTFDREVYPTRGISLLLRTEWADPSIGSGVELRHHVGRVEQVVPLGARLAVRFRAMAGLAEGEDLPLHRRFHLGGAFPGAIFPEARPAFWGLEPQQRMGSAVQLVGLALQAELRDQIYATLGVNVGNAFPEWTLEPREWDVGWGVVLGAVTPVGPLEVAFSGLGEPDWPEVELNLGFRF